MESWFIFEMHIVKLQAGLRVLPEKDPKVKRRTSAVLVPPLGNEFDVLHRVSKLHFYHLYIFCINYQCTNVYIYFLNNTFYLIVCLLKYRRGITYCLGKNVLIKSRNFTRKLLN